VTSGLKFGGDYLVYLGDPIKYHASYIAVCWPNEKEFSARDLLGRIRVGTSTKKTLLVCSVAGDGGVIFHSFAYKSVS
jgi:tRNA-splicing endonuclease subunit Sen34